MFLLNIRLLYLKFSENMKNMNIIMSPEMGSVDRS